MVLGRKRNDVFKPLTKEEKDANRLKKTKKTQKNARNRR